MGWLMDPDYTADAAILRSWLPVRRRVIVAFMQEQGWFHDPYGIHGDRWFSDGKATRLVRDMGTESYDDPPSWEPVESLVPVPPRPGDNTDSRRADAATRVDQAYDAKKAWVKMQDKILGQEPVYWMVSRSRGRRRWG